MKLKVIGNPTGKAAAAVANGPLGGGQDYADTGIANLPGSLPGKDYSSQPEPPVAGKNMGMEARSGSALRRRSGSAVEGLDYALDKPGSGAVAGGTTDNNAVQR